MEIYRLDEVSVVDFGKVQKLMDGIKISLRDSSDGEVIARDWRTNELVRIVWSKGVISSREAGVVGAPDGLWLLPPLIDIQVNGFAGVDFQDPSVTEAEMEKAVAGLKSSACGGCLVTLVTDDWTSLLGKLKQLVALRAENAALREFILGWHLEGPFLSSEEGYRGAHSGEFMIDPHSGHLDAVQAIVGMEPLLMTVAPERRGAIETICEGCCRGIRFSLGHSAAGPPTVAEAIGAGATGITHLGNGCPQMWDRHNNWFWTVVDCKGLYVGLIPDSIHLPAPVFRGMHRALAGRHQVYYTTDAISAAGAPPGRHGFWPHWLEVGGDQVVRQPGRSNFSGSALCPLEGVLRAARMLGEDWQQAWSRFSEVPARHVGMDLNLTVGVPARFCLVRSGPRNEVKEVTLQYSRL
ncbi:MAG: N-acetylglucosamine-6-phosphate deacetylase [Verrucomicrobia subdivision 3 bacterium]|nr:N-acetylglucosamine-6-phosphate deacetylase [Limisphaerales bacterium]MCS1416397.1 N-acetylglucosamine-6-phosphate deacetylase [Limisphaerales bacterium]